MIYPTLRIEVWQKVGSDAYAQARYARVSVERVCPVRLSFQTDNTTVRTDSAGTKGHAQEENAVVTILALPNTRISIGDKLLINGNHVRVIEKHPRYAVGGKLDHYEVRGKAWTER